MKNLWISIGLTLGLFATPLQKATAQDATRTPIKDYLFQSQEGTFVDLKTLSPNETGNGVKFKYELGAALNTGANLDDIFYVTNGDATTPEMTSFKEVTMTDGAAADAAERTQKAIPLSVLGLTDFTFVGKEIKGFAVVPSGGILFAGEDMAVSCQSVAVGSDIWGTLHKDYARVYAHNGTSNVKPAKGTNAPVIIAGGTDAKHGNFIWAQFDYMVDGLNWIFQIRCYENDKIEYMLGNDLEHSKITGNATYAFTPATVQLGNNAATVLTLGNGDAASGTPCWQVLKNANRYVDAESGITLDATCGPTAGRTISIFLPVASNAVSLTTPPVMGETTLEGKVILDPAQTTAASLEAIYAFCISVTTAKNKEYGKYNFPTQSPPTTAFKNDRTNLIYVGKPTDLTQTFGIPLTTDELQPNTEYYIHVYSAYYAPGAYNPYSYSEALQTFGPFKTQVLLPAVENVNATIADGKVQLTFKPADGLKTMVVKSPNATPQTPDGKLAVGDKLGGSQDEVMAIADANTTEFTSDMKAGEGCYLHCYAVENAGTETARYSAATSTTVYRPAETLPVMWGNFNENQVVPSPQSLPLLPPGWQHDAGSTFENSLYFCVSNSYAAGYGIKVTPGSEAPVSVISPAFIPDTALVSATFRSYYSGYTPKEGDWIRIEYRENGGAWTAAKTFTAVDMPAAEANGALPLEATFRCTPGARVEMRYTAQLPAWNSLYILSVEVAGGNPCFQPTGLAIDAAQTTDRAFSLSWQAIEEAVSFTVAYQEANTNTPATWMEKTATAKSLILDGLNARTAYRIKVSAACTIEGQAFNSAYSTPITASTYAGIPYTESLGYDYGSSGSPFDYTTPAERGVETYKGHIGQAWIAETNRTDTWATDNSSSYQRNEDPVAMGIHEEISDGAILCLPRIVTTGTTELSFTLNSFSAEFNEAAGIREIVNGVSPTENEATLRMAVSNNGAFTAEDVILTLTGSELKLTDSTFKLRINKTGVLQIAFIFETPVKHGDDAFYIEAYDLNLKTVPEEGGEDEYTLSLTASPANGGTVTGEGTYHEGDTVTITATANKDYDFVAWLNGTDTLSKTATHVFFMPAEDIDYTALFVAKSGIEDLVKANFSLSAKDGSLYIRNLGGWMVQNIEVYGLTGNRIERFTPNSREDLILPVKAERAMLFVRIATEKGAAVYKVYLH